MEQMIINVSYFYIAAAACGALVGIVSVVIYSGLYGLRTN